MIVANQIKVPVDPQRILTMPRQFGPLDRRLVYEKHIRLMFCSAVWFGWISSR